MELIDWEQLYLDLLEYKEKKRLYNLVIEPDTPRQILTHSHPKPLYKLTAHDSVFEPQTFADRQFLQEAALTILRKYVDKFYRVHQEQWDAEHMVYRELDKKDPNFQQYTIKIPRSKTELIKAINKLIKESKKLYQQETDELPRIHFDRHLYQPLLVRRGDKCESFPPGLNDSENTFVQDLRAYCQQEKDKALAQREVFLLRNLSKGKGIGFFDKRGFYPDFILWIKEDKSQRVVFVEPHGMVYAKAYIHDEKAKLHEDMPNLAKSLGQKAKMKNISLDSFIVSATSFDDLHEKYDDGTWDKEKFADKHILFLERSEEYDYIAKIFG
jgi:hypothetical protein